MTHDVTTRQLIEWATEIVKAKASVVESVDVDFPEMITDVAVALRKAADADQEHQSGKSDAPPKRKSLS